MASRILPMDKKDGSPVLSFRDAILPLGVQEQETLDVEADFYPSDFIVIHSEDEHYEEALVNAMCGLLTPLSGTIKFHDRDWQDLHPDQANALRGRIGIAFRGDNWIPYWSISDNLMLPHLHHTKRAADEVRHEAAGWAAHFGLPGLPQEIPMAISDSDRQCANLARAFIGLPELIVIEHQSGPLTSRVREALVNAIRSARDHGACVIWITREISLGLDDSLPATRRLALGASTLAPLRVNA